jgi:aldehyde oxidoreductase
MDMMAEKIGMDPLELRYLNVYREGDVSLNGHKFGVYPMTAILDKLRPYYQEAVERAKRESPLPKKARCRDRLREYNVTTAPNDHAEVALELNPDGTVTHYNTWEDLGQGADIGTIAHTHEALRPLGLRPDQIKLCHERYRSGSVHGTGGGKPFPLHGRKRDHQCRREIDERHA